MLHIMKLSNCSIILHMYVEVTGNNRRRGGRASLVCVLRTTYEYRQWIWFGFCY